MTDKKDALGREYSGTLSGWLGGEPPPVGARIRILDDPHHFFQHLYKGREAVVLAHKPPHRRFDDFELKCRFVEPNNQWDTMNYCVLRKEHAELVHMGDGTVVPGRDYEFTKLELAQAKFSTMDHRYQDYTNAATFLAALYLRTDNRHHHAVLAMVKADGRINPERLKNYFYRSGLTIDDWATYAEGLPERLEFRQVINWPEVAQEFEELAREQAAT
jgi:hypothetical protein